MSTINQDIEEFHDEPNVSVRQTKHIEVGNISDDRNSDNYVEEEEEAEDTNISIRQRFWYELLRCNGFFELREYDDFNNTDRRGGSSAIDLTMTLASDIMPWRTILYKVFFFSISIEILVQSLVLLPKDERQFFMAYLTHWGLIVSILYQCLAVLCVVHRFIVSTAIQSPWWQNNNNTSYSSSHTYTLPTRLARWTWGVYSLVLPMELIITILFWGLDYTKGDPITYGLCMKHGGIAFLLWLDGSCINAIPIRIRQYIFLQTTVILYVSWSIVFAFSNIPNPNEDDDDYIYNTLRWVNQPEQSAILAAMCGFILSPLVFAFCWFSSLWSSPVMCSLRWDGSRRCLYQGHTRLVPFDLEMTSSVSKTTNDGSH